MDAIKNAKAPLESQIGSAPSLVEDTEEIFWLRQADDYRSRFSLGNALAAQYRFKEAAAAYENALRIRQDDWKLWYSLGGAYLTIREFKKAMAAYVRCARLGAKEQTVAYPLGVAHYLQHEYSSAAQWFKKALPCGDEMAIAVIYWHTLSAFRAGQEPELLSDYHEGMKVGHHTAYMSAVRVFCGEISRDEGISQTEREKDDLNYVIAVYGICGYLEHIGEKAERAKYMEEVLKRGSIWPCISYLAAWNDCFGAEEK